MNEIAASESVVRETAVVRAEGVSRVFSAGGGEVWACRDISLTAAAGELVLVRGASGSGKTTLLNILGGLDAPSAGRVWIGDDELTAMNEQQLVNVRRTRLSYVFQSFGLIPILSAAENIEVPLRIQSMDAGERASRVAEALELVRLQDHALQRPYELSGGQQQRVAIARALAVRPEILIADEPTGQLDSRTAASVMDLIAQLVHERGLAAVISSHDPLLLERADRVIELHDGALLPAARSHGRRAAPPSEAAAEAEAAAALAAAEALSSQLP